MYNILPSLLHRVHYYSMSNIEDCSMSCEAVPAEAWRVVPTAGECLRRALPVTFWVVSISEELFLCIWQKLCWELDQGVLFLTSFTNKKKTSNLLVLWKNKNTVKLWPSFNVPSGNELFLAFYFDKTKPQKRSAIWLFVFVRH
jgi:hypothetical protein